MFVGLKSLIGIHLVAAGDDLGDVVDFYFDDATWVIRYLQVRSSEKILIPMVVLDEIGDPRPDQLTTNLTRERLFENGGIPNQDTEESEMLSPEENISQVNPDSQGMNPGAEMMAYPLIEMNADVEEALREVQDGSKSDLRSFRSEADFLHVQGMDDEVGSLEDLIVDQTWQVIYLVIDCDQGLASKKILLSPNWVDRFSETSGNLYVNVTRKAAEAIPAYDPDQPIDRDLIERLYHLNNQQDPPNPEEG